MIDERSSEAKLLAKNTFYSFFTNYGTLIFQLIISFLMARIISKELWGILILATSYIVIITVISRYFPPALDYSLNYYLPRSLKSNEELAVKSIIKNSFILKLIFLLPIYILSILFFIFITDHLFTVFNNKYDIIFILSPLILIQGLNPVLNSINRSLNLFKLIFYLLILSFILQLSSLLFLLLCQIYNFIQIIAFINVFSALIPFSINLFIILKRIKKLKINKTKQHSFKNISFKFMKYGFPISFGYLVYGFWDQIQILGVEHYFSSGFITGYNISIGYSNYSNVVTNSIHLPLLISFTRMNTSQEYEYIKVVYNLSLKTSLFLILLISGLLFFSADFFLLFIYGTDYIIFSPLLKIMVCATIFNIVIPSFDALLFAKKEIKFFPLIRIFMFIIYISFFFIGIHYFGIIGATLAVSLSNFIIFLVYCILTYRILEIKLEIKALILHFLAFFISLIISLTLHTFFIEPFNFNSLNFFLKTIPSLSIILFLTIFLILVKVLKIFSQNDFENLNSVFSRDKISDKFIRKILKMLM
ncbi:MAG: lipopolysaccharide biosynthesis protein [Candidatus Hermodarchaeota archaeon]